MKNRQLHLKTMHGKLLCIKKIPAPDIKGKIKLVAKDLIVLSVRSKLNESTFVRTNEWKFIL
jgi:hypothetical protein